MTSKCTSSRQTPRALKAKEQIDKAQNTQFSLLCFLVHLLRPSPSEIIVFFYSNLRSSSQMQSLGFVFCLPRQCLNHGFYSTLIGNLRVKPGNLRVQWALCLCISLNSQFFLLSFHFPFFSFSLTPSLGSIFLSSFLPFFFYPPPPTLL